MPSSTKVRTVYVCSECGLESLKWAGRCPECNAWNTFTERTVRPSTPAMGRARSTTNGNAPPPVRMSDPSSEEFPRVEVAISEFDCRLGGGIVPCSLILIGGDPGIGKSTLVAQVAARIATGERSVLYVSGEESGHQLKLRARRLGISGDNVFLLTETNLTDALEAAARIQPDLLI